MVTISPNNFNEDSLRELDALLRGQKPHGSAPTAENCAAIPVVLKQHHNWVAWKLLTRDGKPTKVPFNVLTGAPAKANDPSTWTTFEQVLAATDFPNDHIYKGIGFELGGTNIVGIDFDNAITDDKGIDLYALSILKILGNPYTELSPSGKGLHTFVECDALPEGGRKLSQGHTGIEIYHGREAGRYFTMTGQRVFGDGIPKLDISLPYLLITQNKDKAFKALWLGDTATVDGGDDSSADFALMCRLAVLTKGDREKMEAFFGASALGQREKWTDREDYRQRTIKAAIKDNRTGKPAAGELIFTLPAIPVTEANDEEYVVAKLPNQRDDTEGWFPRGEVSLVGGPSGAGKTTLMYQLLLAQARKGQFLGHETYGLSFCTMGIDRGAAAHRRTMKRMRFIPDMIPFEGLALSFDFDAVQQIVVKIESYAAKHSALPAIVFIEGMDILLTKVNDILCLSTFLNLLHQVAARYHIAIIGSVGAPKIKVGQGYICLRDNVLGSSAWSRESETMIILQYPQGTPAATKGKRVITALLRNGDEEKFTLGFNCGVLERVPDIVENESEHTSTDIEWFQTQARLAKSDPTKQYWTVLDMHEALGMPESTAARHIKHALSKGHVRVKTGKKTGKGAAAQYQWNASDSNPLWVVQQTQAAEQQGSF
jgi:hypothetical protein